MIYNTECTPPAPDVLREAWEQIEIAGPELVNALGASDALRASVSRVLPFSQFASRIVNRYPQVVAAMISAGIFERAVDEGEMVLIVNAACADATGIAETQAALRQVRHTQMLRIAWRDLAGWSTLDETLADLSSLAEGCIASALTCATGLVSEAHGAATHPDGSEARLVVVAMGKLGGGELNFSSDIDLVFLFPRAGDTSGARPVSYQRYFERVGQQLIRLLDEVTADGQAYRVDTRLRPFGASGALAFSFSALESYLQQQGRDWERYAWVKARAVTGMTHDLDALQTVVRPFVFRRYVDYGVLSSLRDMKGLIAREIGRSDMRNHIKLGPGGIREVEFVVQSFQLLRGGRDKALRSPRLNDVLPLLAKRGLISDSAARDLHEGYRFLRHVENRLQAWDDRQTHVLPDDQADAERLALSMGYPGATQFTEQLQAHRTRIARHFDALLFAPDDEATPAVGADLAGVWDGSVARDAAAQNLREAGLEDVDGALEVLHRLRHDGIYKRIDEQGARRLDALVPRLITAVGQRGHDQQQTLERLAVLLEAVGRRSAYVALLNENPPVLARLVELVARSSWLADQVTAHPLLMDELIDPRIYQRPPNRTTLVEDINTRFAGIDPQDLEAQMEALRQFQQAAVFQVAVADLSGVLPLMSVSDRLTGIAELVIQTALDVTQWQLRQRYGTPRFGNRCRAAGFAVIAYGKLGGFELGYGSDLDLVFVHNSRGSEQATDGAQVLDNARFFGRLAQRLVHMLTTQTPSGRLYDVDTRLRPSGKAGALVTSIAAFERYQRSDAWVWEHQALLRTRAVAGDPACCAAVERIRREVLTQRTDSSALKAEVVAMRARMRGELDHSADGLFDIKQGHGGIADIEFLVQYLVLANAAMHPGLVTHSDNIRQIYALEEAGLLASPEAIALIRAYRDYRKRLHAKSLQREPNLVPETEVSAMRDAIVTLWQEHLGT